MACLNFPAIPEISRKRERRNPASFSRDSRSSYIAAGKREAGTGSGFGVQSLFLERVYSMRARGMNAEAIAARLSLDVALVREILNPQQTTCPEGVQP